MLKDGEILAAAEEERFTRRKHEKDFPRRAIRYCLTTAGIEIHQVDYIGFFWNPRLTLKMGISHAIRYFPRGLPYALGMGYIFFLLHKVKKLLRQEFHLNLGEGSPKFLYVDHHFAHAASTFFLSPFEEAAVITIDGQGEIDSAVFFQGKNNVFQKLKSVKFPHSLGLCYASVTKYLGFKPDSDEYKVMGLAPYGEPTYIDLFRKIIQTESEGTYKIDLTYFDYWTSTSPEGWVSPKFVEAFGPPRKEGDPLEKRHRDIAASLQQALEEGAFHMLRWLRKETGQDRLCLAGGVGMNCTMNGKICKNTGFREVFVQPVAYDAGTSLGTALYIYHYLLNNPRKLVMSHTSYGPEYANDSIGELLRRFKLTHYEFTENIAEKTARFLADGKIVGWFQGRMEFGARALGSRSILAHPGIAKMKDLVNACVKYREGFRPFAPSVLEEKAGEYFELEGKAPFMTLTCQVLDDKRKEVPAITHVDGTSRIQTVSKETNPLYWQLLKEFEKITGIPMVLNTSFNVQGEPIVCTPEEAIRCFFSTGLDYLVLGNYILWK